MNGVMSPCIVRNTQPAAQAALPALGWDNFRAWITDGVNQGGRLVSFFGYPAGNAGITLLAALARPGESSLDVATTLVAEAFPSLTPDCPQAHWFEREIAEQWGVKPEGHPWLKPLRFHASYRPGHEVFPSKPAPQAGLADFYRIAGTEAHEVAVGPVHAGIIEPGHFRFQCHGEEVLHLEISLGYQHRGVERALIGGPNARTVHLMETLAGDTTIGHTTAYCQMVESLAGVRVPARAQALRAIALELERLANHTGDLGALAGDAGYLPTMSFCGRIRGDFLNLTALLCGNRFGRNLVRPGGVAFDLSKDRLAQLEKRLAQAREDVTNAVNLLWECSSVRSRFENIGTLSEDTCIQLGLVGPVARACGVERDVRHEFPFGLYRFFQIPVSAFHHGNVFGRAYVRWLEIQHSIDFLEQQLKSLPGGNLRAEMKPLPPGQFCMSLVEGWRGEICHAGLTDAQGQWMLYKVKDPSFHNWMGLAIAMRGQQISDFPLCNKSFNLSYCGHDL